MSGQVIGELASIQAGLVNIGTLIELDLGLKSSTDKKLDKIFKMLKKEKIEKSEAFYAFLNHVIDSCGCEEYTQTRLIPPERTVRKTTHTSSKPKEEE